MDKEEWKSFLRFIDEGSERELQQRKKALQKVLTLVSDPGVRSDARRMLRLVDEEVLIRQNLSVRKKASR
ncbi:hypothetical protein [Piscinibacter gummiphilus]|jgi:hypothetical protein|uniref:Uncharacterized protein n=1 Tax=Piscinibacter gummiphilus TaxID=946333 RepID=A0ABZ0D257_9BURK|nr:hypothetical protein [Piscinibacter gummiphilus]WOB11266.1 hypothetical protein RXV79_26915 [Piscinibacter gummiphilus]